MSLSRTDQDNGKNLPQQPSFCSRARWTDSGPESVESCICTPGTLLALKLELSQPLRKALLSVISSSLWVWLDNIKMPLCKCILGNNIGLLRQFTKPLEGLDAAAAAAQHGCIKDLCSPLSRGMRVQSYGKVDEDGSRYILGDDNGMLSLLILAHNNQFIVGLKLEPIGRSTVPSSISYLDNGVVYLGSQRGDSQLIRLHAQPIDPSQQPPSHVEILETHMSLGPIVDFCVVDVERQGQGQVRLCLHMCPPCTSMCH